VNFPISTKTTNAIEVNPMKIPAKFGSLSIVISEKVTVYRRRTQSNDKNLNRHSDQGR